jgi:hypothetical protein
MIRAMVDLETLGTGVNACIIQIGACHFAIDGSVARTFKTGVDAEDCVANGAVIDAATVYWWLMQSDKARASIRETAVRTELDALNALNDFLSEADEIWSHATFDFVIICEALKRRKIKPKFNYKAARDIRTLMSFSPLIKTTSVREGTHHDALDDAVYQAKYCAEVLTALKALHR